MPPDEGAPALELRHTREQRDAEPMADFMRETAVRMAYFHYRRRA